jgi:hypothetical protein
MTVAFRKTARDVEAQDPARSDDTAKPLSPAGAGVT